MRSHIRSVRGAAYSTIDCSRDRVLWVSGSRVGWDLDLVAGHRSEEAAFSSFVALQGVLFERGETSNASVSGLSLRKCEFSG